MAKNTINMMNTDKIEVADILKALDDEHMTIYYKKWVPLVGEEVKMPITFRVVDSARLFNSFNKAELLDKLHTAMEISELDLDDYIYDMVKQLIMEEADELSLLGIKVLEPNSKYIRYGK